MNRLFQVALFITWPFIAFVMAMCMVVMFVIAWFLIPLGTPSEEGGKWTLRFPWSEK